MGSLQRLRNGQPSDMGSLQRSSSLGRAGETSLQTAARALQQREREQKLRNSPYGRPLLKSRSDPAAIRKQRYATSSSEIGSGVHLRWGPSRTRGAVSKAQRLVVASTAWAPELRLIDGRCPHGHEQADGRRRRRRRRRFTRTAESLNRGLRLPRKVLLPDVS